jgi:hypothetical protein
MLPPDGFRRTPRISDSRLQHTISYRLPAISCQLCPLRAGCRRWTGRGYGVARPPGAAVGIPVTVGVGVPVGVAAAVALGVGVGGLTTS